MLMAAPFPAFPAFAFQIWRGWPVLPIATLPFGNCQESAPWKSHQPIEFKRKSRFGAVAIAKRCQQPKTSTISMISTFPPPLKGRSVPGNTHSSHRRSAGPLPRLRFQTAPLTTTDVLETRDD